MLMDIIKNLMAGMAVGVVFGLLRLPVPAPNAIPPVMAILGITLGYLLIVYLLKNFG